MDNELGPSERLLLEALQIEDSPRMADQSRIRQRVLMGVGVAAAGAATTTVVEAAIGSSPIAAPAAALGLSASSTVTTATTGAVVASSAAAAGGVATTGGAAVVGGATGAATSGFGLLKALLVVGGVAGLGGGAVALSWQHSEPTERAPVEAQVASPQDALPAEQGSKAEVEALKAEEAEAPVVAPEETEQPQRATPNTLSPQTQKKDADPASTLKDEALLMSKAQAALQKGDTATAISVLSEHRKQFPSGVLSGEREAALAVAYCKSGNLSEGRAKAERFVASHPSSPMVQRLRTACKLTME